VTRVSDVSSKRGKRPARADLEKWSRWLVPGAAALLLLLTLVIGWIFGPAFGVLILAVGAMLAAVTSLWNSLRALFGETPLSREDAYAIGAPSTEEEQKRAVVRAIKDLEFERSVGKISEADYRELVGRYRNEAKRLLRQIDAAARPEREGVERLVASHLRAQGIAPGWLSLPSAERSADAAADLSSDAEDEPPSGAGDDDADDDEPPREGAEARDAAKEAVS
jgi:hypothetical protein